MKPTIAIIAGGDVADTSLTQVKRSDIVIGVDRGAWWVLKRGIVPTYAIGDFDSVLESELAEIKLCSPNVVQYKREKDESDLELGLLLAVSLEPATVDVYGALGSRFDHSLAGIFLLEQFRDIDITYRNKHNELCLITNQKIIKKDKFRYCSFISLTDRSEITLDGFKYPLTKGTLKRSQSLGVSNEIIHHEATITVHTGKILCIKSKD